MLFKNPNVSNNEKCDKNEQALEKGRHGDTKSNSWIEGIVESRKISDDRDTFFKICIRKNRGNYSEQDEDDDKEVRAAHGGSLSDLGEEIERIDAVEEIEEESSIPSISSISSQSSRPILQSAKKTVQYGQKLEMTYDCSIKMERSLP